MATKKTNTQKDMANLSRADIVITSPQNFAVALEHTSQETPIVLAKCGKTDLENFLLKAESFNLPIIENYSFTKDIFAALKAARPIPKDFYLPAAQSLAFVYKAKTSPRPIKYIRVMPDIKKAADALQKETTDILNKIIINLISVDVGKEIYARKKILEDSFSNLRQKVALDLGLALPAFKLELNANLEDWEYKIFIKELPYASEKIEKGVKGDENLLAIKNKLGHLIYSNAYHLLGYMDVYNLLANLKKTKKALIDELFPEYLSVPVLRLILKNLLKEEVTIRNLENILEVILENLSSTSNPGILTEYIRIENKAYITEKLKDREGNISVLVLDPSVEKLIFEKIDEKNNTLAITPNEALEILKAIDTHLKSMQSLGIKTAVLTSPYLRRFVRKITENTFPGMPIISYAEIMPMSKVRTMATVKV